MVTFNWIVWCCNLNIFSFCLVACSFLCLHWIVLEQTTLLNEVFEDAPAALPGSMTTIVKNKYRVLNVLLIFICMDVIYFDYDSIVSYTRSKSHQIQKCKSSIMFQAKWTLTSISVTFYNEECKHVNLQYCFKQNCFFNWI